MPVISLKLSPNGKQQVERALTEKAWGVEELMKALMKLEEATDRKVSLQEATVKKFRAGNPIERKNFVNLCTVLGLNWAEVKDPPEQTEVSEPLVADKRNFNIQPPIIEGWVGQVKQRCCQKILYQHGKIQLLNQTEVGVDELYVDVWLLNRSPRTYQVSESKLLESFDLRTDRLGLGDRIQRNEGMAVAHRNSKLLILGKPGSGKTTFLKHLAVDCSTRKFQPDLIPVLIELRRIRSAEWQLLNAISESLETDPLKTQELLEQGKLLILLDGLDEVPTNALRRGVQAQVSQLSQEPKYANNRLIITCRTQIIEAIPAGFTLVEVAPFKDEQVKAFVFNWFRASGQTESNIDQQWQAFSDEMQEESALRELTRIPVLLSLICWVLQDSGELPAQTAALYRKGVRLLLEKWNDRKDIPEWEIGKEVYRQLSIEEKESLLTEIAARKFENPSNFVLFEQADLTQQIAQFLKLNSRQDGEAVLRAIEAQHGLLVERADELWSFSHLTFQEYFTAQWFIQNHEWQKLAQHSTDLRWREVLRIAVRIKPPPVSFWQEFKQSIDDSIANDPECQNILVWAQEKSKDVQMSYKPATLRACYFSLGFEFYPQEIFSGFNKLFRNYIYNQTSGKRRFSPLKVCLELPLSIDDDFAARYFVQQCDEMDLDIALDQTVIIRVRYYFDGEWENESIQSIFEDLQPFFPEFINAIEALLTELPKRSIDLLRNYSLWWAANSEQWLIKLRQILIYSRNIGHDWQLTELQEQALQRYYDANKFLVELLKEPGAVSDPVRQEIEDNLLLPIATLKQRLPDQYS